MPPTQQEVTPLGWFPISWTSYTLQPTGFHLLACPWNYSNKSITSSQGNQTSPHLITTKPVSQSSYLFTLLPSGPPPLGYEYKRLINCCRSHLSSVGCHVFGHLPNPRVGLPPSPTGWREGKQNSKLCRWVVTFKCNLPSLPLIYITLTTASLSLFILSSPLHSMHANSLSDLLFKIWEPLNHQAIQGMW